MPKPASTDDACDGPKFDAPGVLSAACIACGKCDAVQALLHELVPAHANNATTRAAANARATGRT
jgi:hypothetical protein